jgi:hypothetical protein
MADNKDIFSTITPKMVLGQLFKSRDVMHIVHLKTNSFAVHKATDIYYNELLELVDKLAEIHFGVMGKKELDEIPSAKYIEPTQHLKDISYYLTGNRRVFNTSAEQNVIDEILGLIYQTLYRLTLE